MTLAQFDFHCEAASRYEDRQRANMISDVNLASHGKPKDIKEVISRLLREKKKKTMQVPIDRLLGGSS